MDRCSAHHGGLCVGSKIDEDDEEAKLNNSGLTDDVAAVMCELLTMRREKDLSFGERKLLDTVKVLLVKEVALASGKAEGEVEAEITGFFAVPAKQAASAS